MNCERIEERLLESTAADPRPAFDAAELDHLGTCPRCRAREAEASAVFARLARAASSVAPPDPGYWASVVPRLRRRIGAEPRGVPRPGNPLVVRTLMPAAAAAVLAIALLVAINRTPESAGTVDSDAIVPGPVGPEALASLSDAELQEFRLAGATTGLLESAETSTAADWTIADFLSDLISEDGDSVIYAVAEPEKLLAQLDDAGFAEIVSILEHQ